MEQNIRPSQKWDCLSCFSRSYFGCLPSSYSRCSTRSHCSKNCFFTGKIDQGSVGIFAFSLPIFCYMFIAFLGRGFASQASINGVQITFSWTWGESSFWDELSGEGSSSSAFAHPSSFDHCFGWRWALGLWAGFADTGASSLGIQSSCAQIFHLCPSDSKCWFCFDRGRRWRPEVRRWCLSAADGLCYQDILLDPSSPCRPASRTQACQPMAPVAHFWWASKMKLAAAERLLSSSFVKAAATSTKHLAYVDLASFEFNNLNLFKLQN